MSILSNLELIRRVPLFATLTPKQAEGVAAAVTKQRFKRGEVLVTQGEKSDRLIILLTGRARVVTTDSRGREVILATLGAGDYTGEMSLIDNQPHSASVRADIQTDTLLLGRAEFARCLGENSAMAYAVMKGLVQRLRKADRNIESLALMDVYGRVARVLIESATDESPGRKVINGKLSRQDVAKMVGASREMVSRVIKDLEEKGFIEEHADGVIYINDRRRTPGRI
ncbi:MAG TPA: Crp/Fnr family transcriptional regulator [Burkholderiaceae bacterium]|nr:Crp/Fnr family transcriptional regulator [Burkholderiaceae bacterium]